MIDRELILELRMKGNGYGVIASITGYNESTVKYHCKKNGLTGSIGKVTELKERICRLCDSNYTFTKDWKNPRYCSKKCSDEAKPKKAEKRIEYCRTCGKSFYPKGTQKHCSDNCLSRHARCVFCGKSFKQHVYKNADTCSKECMKDKRLFITLEEKMNLKDKILKFVDSGFSERKIASNLGITRNVARKIMKNTGISTKYEFTNDPGDIKERVVQLFGGKWEYVGGYNGSDDYFTLKCKTCGLSKEVNAICLRRKKTPICDCVIEEKKKAAEQERLKVAEISKYNNYISNSIVRIKITYKPTRKFTCKECGIEFYSKRDKKFCAQSCMLKYNNSSKKLTKRKRIIDNGKVEDITLSKLYKRDKGVCYICGTKCNKKDYKLSENGAFVAGDKYPSIEHIIPVVKGGTHTWDNVMLAHRLCNSLKGAQSGVVMNGDRLMLNL